MPKINWEKEIWEWATKEFPHIHSDKFEELFKIINQARQEERERIINHWIVSKRKRDGTAQGCLNMIEQFDKFIKTLTPN